MDKNKGYSKEMNKKNMETPIRCSYDKKDIKITSIRVS